MNISPAVMFALIVSSACCVSATPSLAQGVKPGDRVSPIDQLPLRTTPPEGFLGLKGSETGTAKPTDEYLVLEQRNIPTIFGDQKWLRLEEIGAGTSGWVYSGQSDSKTQNVRPRN